MHWARAHRRGITWLAAWAILAAAFAPMVSRVMAAADPLAWAEVCTQFGAKRVMLASDDGSQPAPSSPMEHCAYCVAAPHGPALPPVALAAWQPPALQFELPRLFLVAPYPLFAWSPALARAPPRG